MSILGEIEAAVGYEPVHVHVVNASDLQPPVRTEEVEAQHFTSQSFVLPPTGNVAGQVQYNDNVPAQILQLDPLRKKAIISINGSGQCFICHSQQQAQALQFGTTQQDSDAAALLTAPFAFPAEATGPLWAVLANTPVSPPAGTAGTYQQNTGAANTQTTLTLPAPAAGLADILTVLNWSVNGGASTTDATLTVQSGTDILYQQDIPVGSLSGSVNIPAGGWTGQPGTNVQITLTAVGAALTTTLRANFLQQTNGSITVGVLQERRNS